MAAPRRGGATGTTDEMVKGSSDRLSALRDVTLIRILSHLPTDEAVRSSVLSHRWRHLYATVPVVDLVDPNNAGYGHGRYTSNLPVCFDQKVTCAMLSRDPTAPILTFRLDVCHPTYTLLDQWILAALRSGAEELDLKLRCGEASRLRLCPFGHYEGMSADFDEGDLGRYVKTPRQLLHTAALRSLSLSRWRLQLPGDVPPFMSLESLVLHRIMRCGHDHEALQRLISSCPRLVDLTLEECPDVTTLTVTSASLHRFALVCCHNATHIRLESRRLRSLRYQGGLPVGTQRSCFFWVADHSSVTALTIDICEGVHGKTPRQIATVTELISRCNNLEFLHLALRPAMAYHSGMFATALRRLLRLRRLELKGSLHSEHGVSSVSVLLQNTPNLEKLSLFLVLPDPTKKKENYLYDFKDRPSDDGKEQVISCDGRVYVPHGVWMAPVRCFRHSLRRISLVGYRGLPFERMIAKFLLCKAVVLEELSVSLAPASYAHRDGIQRELMSWRFNRRTRVTFV